MSKKPIIMVLIGLVLGVSVVSQNPLVLVLKGYKVLLDGLAWLSMSNNIGNVLSWIIMIGISFLPLCLFYYKGGKENKRIAIILVLSMFVFTANLYLLNEPIADTALREMKILSLSLLYLTGYLAYYFEFYYKNESHLHTLIMGLVYIALLSYGMFLGTQINSFYSSPKGNMHSNILFVISTLIIYFNINLLLKLERFFSLKLYTDLNQASLYFIRELKVQADKVISIIIYGFVVSLALAFLTIGIYDTVNVGFTVPIVMIMISVFINLYLKLLINALSVKEENDLFI